MDAQHDRQANVTRPIRCTQCSEPMELPLCCSTCGALNPQPPSMFTYFELFGIAQDYDVDPADLRRRYLNLSRSIHPDIAGRESEKVRRQALELSSGMNRAYETLRNPVTRAEYLLQIAGGPNATDDKSAPHELLGEIMMLREEIDEALSAEDTSSLQSLKETVATRHAATLKRIAQTCRGEDMADATVQKQLRQQLNAMKYWINLLDQIPAQSEE